MNRTSPQWQEPSSIMIYPLFSGILNVRLRHKESFVYSLNPSLLRTSLNSGWSRMGSDQAFLANIVVMLIPPSPGLRDSAASLSQLTCPQSYTSTQETYDDQTHHGILMEAQNQWTERIHRALRLEQWDDFIDERH